MGSLGDLIRQGHTPGSPTPAPQINLQKTKPPVRFTTDPLEFIEGKEYLGEKLFTKQKEIVNEFFSRDPSGKRFYNELVLIIGMRGGKSILASWIGSFCANYLLSMGKEYKSHFGLSKVSNISIPVIANSEDQAERTIFGYLKQTHTSCDFWKKINQWLIDMEPLGMRGSYFNEESGSVNYRFYDLNLHSVPSTSDTLAGLTSFCTLFDEISRLRVSQSGDIQGKTEKKSAQAIYYTLIRQIKTFRNEGNSVVVSSPMYEDDFGMQLLLKSGTLKTGQIGEFTIPILSDKIPQNQKKKTRVGYHYATWEYNENFKETDFQDEKRESITTFKRDYMAVPPASVEPFFEDRIALRAAINPHRPHIVECETGFIDKHRKDNLGNILDTRRYVIKKISTCIRDKMTKRYICCDQGHKWDNFVLTIGHAQPIQILDEETKIEKRFLKTVVDAIVVWEPLGNEATVEFDNVEKIILELSEFLLIECVTYDRWQSTKPVQTLFDKNVNSQILSVTNAMYQSFKKRVYRGLVDCVDVNFEFQKKKNALMDELVKLQLIKGGKIDHTPSSCFVLETKISLLNGEVKTLHELIDSDEDEFWLYSNDGKGNVVPGKGYHPRITKYTDILIEVELDNGIVERCTPEHPWMLRDGTYRRADELEKGTSLMPLYRGKKYLPGYETVMNPKNGKIYATHRIVAKYIHQSDLELSGSSGEIVHHKDFNKRNNSPGNLQVMSQKDHMILHHALGSKNWVYMHRWIENNPEEFSQLVKKALSSQEVRKKMSEASRRLWEEKYDVMVQSIKDRYKNSKFVEKMRNIAKEKYHTDREFREKFHACGRKHNQSKEGRELHRKIANEYFSNQENRDKVAKRNLELCKDPKYVKKITKGFNKFNFDKNHPAHKTRLFKCHLSRRLVNTIKRDVQAGFSLEKVCEKYNYTRNQIQNHILEKWGYSWEEYITKICQYNHKVKSIKIIKLNKPVPVGDITVEKYSNFSLASGVVVHNSKDISDTICRLDAIIQNQEYDSYGGSRGDLKGGLAYINPSAKEFSPQLVQTALQTAYGNKSSIWTDPVDLSSGVGILGHTHRSIWGRQGIKRTKDVQSREQHPAQNFFKQKGSS